MLTHPSLVPPLEKLSARALASLSCRTEYDVKCGLEFLGHKVACLGVGEELGSLRRKLFEFKPQIVFNLIEEFASNPFYDQNIVAHLELLGLPYTGCNSRGLILARDKSLSKEILIYHGIETPAFFVLQHGKQVANSPLPFPLFVKTLVEESSTGIAQASVVHSQKELKKRAQFLFDRYQTDVLVERYIEGRELYVSVLGNSRLQTLPPIEMEFGRLKRHGFAVASSRVKWSGKYRFKNGIRIKRADLDLKAAVQLQKAAKQIYRLLGLSGYARLDFRMSADGTIYFLEANPNPDIGAGQEMAVAASLLGWSYPQLLQKIVSLSAAAQASQRLPIARNAL